MDVNAQVLQRWRVTSTRLSPLYVFREMPASHDYDGRPFGHLSLQDDNNGLFSVRGLTHEPTVNDALYKLIHDPVYAAPVVPYESMQVRLVSGW